MIEADHPRISIIRQCELLGVNRSGFYYRPEPESSLNIELMHLLDEQFTATPFYGIRRMTACLRRQGYHVNHKRISRLMRLMGIQAIYPRPRTSIPDRQHKVYPYLLDGVEISYPDHVWSTDITYIRLHGGFVYLAAILDWFSRYVISWRLSNTLDQYFCLEMLEEALSSGKPAIFNSDQGSQFTAEKFTGMLEDRGIEVSMDGRGRYYDNIFIERLWRTVKYEEVYLRDYQTVSDAHMGIDNFFRFYNYDRVHQSLGYRVPAEVYRGGKADFSSVLFPSSAEYCKECASSEKRTDERQKLAIMENNC